MTASPVVFVVDDDEAVRRSLELLLSAAGLQSRAFATAEAFLAEHDPDFVFHCYAIHSKPTIAPLGCGAFWRAPARGFEQRTIEVPGLVGEREGRDDDGGPGPAKYYTFLVKRDRAFACPGLVP